MNYKKTKGGIKAAIPDFSITETLECGQCFRYYKIKEEHYGLVALGTYLEVQKEKDTFLFSCSSEDFEKKWIRYFDLDRDYKPIKAILEKDDVLNKAIRYAPGIRILNQDPWECLISFIISQNKSIPMIRQIIIYLSERYGDLIHNAKNVYTFPTPEQLSSASHDDLRDCKTGFRAKYIKNATEKVNSREINLEKWHDLDYISLKKELVSLYGVGNKIADCVALFSFEKREAFPVDVWVGRVMQHFYGKDENIPPKEITNIAHSLFGTYAGYAQQYLFYYARQMKIGA